MSAIIKTTPDWKPIDVRPGFYWIKNVATGKLADVARDEKQRGAVVCREEEKDEKKDWQRWLIVENGPQVYGIISKSQWFADRWANVGGSIKSSENQSFTQVVVGDKQDWKFLGPPSSYVAPEGVEGLVVEIYLPGGRFAPVWTESTDPQIKVFEGFLSDKTIEVDPVVLDTEALDPGNNIQRWSLIRDDRESLRSQLKLPFVPIDVPEGIYRIKNVETGKFAAVWSEKEAKDNRKRDEGIVICEEVDEKDAQKWDIVKNNTHLYYIKPVDKNYRNLFANVGKDIRGVEGVEVLVNRQEMEWTFLGSIMYSWAVTTPADEVAEGIEVEISPPHPRLPPSTHHFGGTHYPTYDTINDGKDRYAVWTEVEYATPPKDPRYPAGDPNQETEEEKKPDIVVLREQYPAPKNKIQRWLLLRVEVED